MDSLLNVVTTTLNAWSKEVFDNVINQNPLLYCFKKLSKLRKMNPEKVNGSIMTIPGGKRIEERVSLVENGNTAWVDYDDDLTTTRREVLNTAIFDWKIVATTAVAYDAEIAVNQDSEYRKSNIVEDIIANAESSIINAVGTALFADGTTDAKSLDGLQALITDNGTGTVGGIATTTYAGWKNQYVNLAKTHTSAQLLEVMGELYRKCRGQTDIIVMGNALYGEFESAMIATVKPTSFKGLEDAWFDYLTFHKAVVIYDEHCPANHIYFLDTASIKLNFLKGKEFSVGERERPAGTQKNIWPITAMCNFSVRNRRNLGVVVVATSD